MEWVHFVTGVLGTLVLGYLWWIGHPYLIDTGDSPGNRRARWNMHSLSHLVGGAAVSFVLTLITGRPVESTLETMYFGLLVEVGQAMPRKGLGYFEGWDLVWDFAGAVVGTLAALGLRAVLSIGG